MAHASLSTPVARVGLGARKTRAPRRVSTVARAGKTGAGDDGDADDTAGGKFMGRRGTYRKEVEDDAETAAARSSVKQQGGFGKPVTAKETWQPFQRTARAGLLEAAEGERTGSGESRDLVLTSLYISMEDDAFKSRTAVCLPIAAYVKRVDKLMDEFTARELPALVESKGGAALTTPEIIEALETHLFVTNKYCAPKGWRELYSPYRTYFHNVVAQKVGIPATLAALYIGCVDRLRAKGVIPEGEGIDVLIRPKARNGMAGVTAPVAPWGVPSGAKRPANSVVCTHNMALKLQLAALKRAYWPWEWDDSRDSGVLLAVEAAAYGQENRMNTAAGFVGIIQPSGRPFGDLPMAILATERLLELDGGEGYEQRDLGVLMFHDGKIKEALEHLEAFELWREGGGDDAAPNLVSDVLNAGGTDAVLAAELQVREDEALAKLMLDLRRMALEEALEGGIKSGDV